LARFTIAAAPDDEVRVVNDHASARGAARGHPPRFGRATALEEGVGPLTAPWEHALPL
jgi:hypothetical protein